MQSLSGVLDRLTNTVQSIDATTVHLDMKLVVWHRVSMVSVINPFSCNNVERWLSLRRASPKSSRELSSNPRFCATSHTANHITQKAADFPRPRDYPGFVEIATFSLGSSENSNGRVSRVLPRLKLEHADLTWLFILSQLSRPYVLPRHRRRRRTKSIHHHNHRNHVEDLQPGRRRQPQDCRRGHVHHHRQRGVRHHQLYRRAPWRREDPEACCWQGRVKAVLEGLFAHPLKTSGYDC